MFAGAYERGEVEVEHWSFLAFSQRLEAGGARPARDRDALDRRLVDGGERRVRTGRHPVRRGRAARAARRPTSRCCTRRSPTGPATSRCTRRCSRGCGARSAARRGAIVTVERIVDDIRPWSHLVRIPAHRVLAVVECPMGAHPGGLLHRRSLPVDGLRRGLRLLGRGPGRDPRATTTTTWIRHWVLDVETQEQWLDAARRRAGRRRCGPRPRPTRGTPTQAAYPPDLDAPGERVGARRGVGRAPPGRAGRRARCRRGARGRRRREPRRPGSACSSRATRARDVQLTAEIGLWGYDATPADPFVLNHRNFPTATMLGDAAMVLGALVGGAGHDDDRLSRRRADRPLRQRELDADRAAAVPRRFGRRQRRREHRDRERRGRDADAAAHAGRLLVHHVAGPGRARARHRSRRAREARRSRDVGARADRGARRRRAARRSDRGAREPRAVGSSRSRPTSRELAGARPPTRSARCGAGTRGAGSCELDSAPGAVSGGRCGAGRRAGRHGRSRGSGRSRTGR